jgi:hypothetical protein
MCSFFIRHVADLPDIWLCMAFRYPGHSFYRAPCGGALGVQQTHAERIPHRIWVASGPRLIRVLGHVAILRDMLRAVLFTAVREFRVASGTYSFVRELRSCALTAHDGPQDSDVRECRAVASTIRAVGGGSRL